VASVVIAERLGAHFRMDGEYLVEVQHRDVDRAPFAPISR
jgi:RNase adaptor protein for sRNA GlmZ degradation